MRAIKFSVMALACALLIGIGTAPPANAQLVIKDAATGGEDATTLATILLGTGLNAPQIVGTPTLTGNTQCAGSFEGAGKDGLEIDSGIILSTGKVLDVLGPNNSDSTTTGFATAGDQFLADLAGTTLANTFDACVLEFDFQCPDLESMNFRYQFTSEEYNEFVGSAFNNTFGFALNGDNIAIVPDSVVPDVPVAINNVHCGSAADPTIYDPNAPISPNSPYCDLFINNDVSDGGPFLNLEPDGVLVPLDATGAVVSGTNTIKLAIADVGDSVLDSWMFLEAGSFVCAAAGKTWTITSLPSDGTLIDTETGALVTLNQVFLVEPILSYVASTSGTFSLGFAVTEGGDTQFAIVTLNVTFNDSCTIVGRQAGCDPDDL